MIPKEHDWPQDFTNRIYQQFPETAQSFINALNQQASVSLRINPAKFGFTKKLEKIPWCNTGYFLPSRPRFAVDPLWHAGAYYVQEASSMFLEQVFEKIEINHPKIVLDLCAAPGGKSTHLASLLKPEDLLIANEVIRSRVPVLIENLTKWGYPNFLVTNSDAKQFGELGGLFDVLLIDAPCSGEGLFRRDPDASNEWSVENSNLCSVRQRRILAESWNCLKTGGYLIYSTCTFNPAENEENLKWLKSKGNFESIPINLKPKWNVDEIEVSGIHGYRFLPHLSKGEGFFISLLRKTENNPTPRYPRKFKTKLQRPEIQPLDWLNHPEDKKLFQHQDQLKFIPAKWEKEILFLFEKINLVKSGIHIGTIKKNSILPDHDLAMSIELNKTSFNMLELDLMQALLYLRRGPLHLNLNQTEWVLLTFKQLPIGFIKNIGTRFNNYYPKEWRLRLENQDNSEFWYE